MYTNARAKTQNTNCRCDVRFPIDAPKVIEFNASVELSVDCSISGMVDGRNAVHMRRLGAFDHHPDGDPKQHNE